MTVLYEHSYCPVAAMPESKFSHTVNTTAQPCSKTISSQRRKQEKSFCLKAGEQMVKCFLGFFRGMDDLIR